MFQALGWCRVTRPEPELGPIRRLLPRCTRRCVAPAPGGCTSSGGLMSSSRMLPRKTQDLVTFLPCCVLAHASRTLNPCYSFQSDGSVTGDNRGQTFPMNTTDLNSTNPNATHGFPFFFTTIPPPGHQLHGGRLSLKVEAVSRNSPSA